MKFPMPSDKLACWNVIKLMSSMHSVQRSHVQAVQGPWLLRVVDSSLMWSLDIKRR